MNKLDAIQEPSLGPNTKSHAKLAYRFLPEQCDRFEPGSWYCWRIAIRFDPSCGSRELRLAADSKYWLWVNGTMVIREGGLKRGPKPNASYADAINLSEHLIPGDNTIAIHQWYFGRDGFSHCDSGSPELYLEFADRSIELLACKAVRDPSMFDAGTVRPGALEGSRLAESSVGYDARKSLGPWTRTDFDASTWKDPVYIDADAPSALGEIHDRPIPFFQWKKAVDSPPLEWTREPGGYRLYTLNLPHNIHACPRLLIDSLEGLKIQILSDCPTHVLTTEYITIRGRQSWEAPGWMNGHKLLFRIPEEVEVIELGYRETAYPSQRVGEFKCGYADLNDLWNRSALTLTVTMRDNFMDCPCRERAQWWGDEIIQLGQIPYSLDERAYQLVRKGIYELSHWQRKDHALFSPIPQGSWRRELPLQMLAAISKYGIWEYYIHSGDFEPIEDTFESALQYLNLWPENGKRLPHIRPGDWNWGDWGENLDMTLLTAGWLVLAWQATAAIAAKLGRTEIASKFTNNIKAMRQTLRNECESKGGFRGPAHKGPLDDRSNALMVLSGVADPSRYTELAETLYNERHASPYMEKYVLEALFLIDRPEMGIARMRERYKSMLATDSTTLWEFFPEAGFQNNTNNHSWSGGPLIVMSRFLAGLYPAEPGWKKLGVHPRPGTINQFESSVNTSNGFVSLRYVNKGNVFQIEMNVPRSLDIQYDFTSTTKQDSLLAQKATDEAILIPATGSLTGGHWTIEGKPTMQPAI